MEIKDQQVFESGRNEDTCNEVLLRPKRRRNIVSYCETKTYRRKSRSMSDSKIYDTNSSLIPAYVDNIKENGMLHKRLKSNESESRKEKSDALGLKNEIELMKKCEKSVSDLNEINNCILQKKQGRRCRRSSRQSSSLNVSKQLADNSASKSSATNPEETDFCAQLMKLEKVDCDGSLHNTSDNECNRKDTDTTSSLSERIARRRSCKRKNMFGLESVAGRKTDCENVDINNENEIDSKSVSDVKKVLPSSQSNYESLCTSTPVNKRFRRNRKRKKSDCREAYSFDTSVTHSFHEDFLSEQNISCETSSLPTPIAAVKSGMPELGDASISPPTSLKPSCPYTSM